LQKMAADVITTLDVKGITVALAEADAIVTRVYKLNYATPADIKAALSEVTTGKVSVDARTSSLVVTAKISEQEQIVDIIDELDLELAQVFFEASLYELSNDASKRLGIDWTVNKLVFGYNTLSQLATVSLDFDNKISALADEGKAKLISKQHTFTVDGKEGRILIGDRIPVIVQKVEQSQVVNTVEYINAGIELSILPKVSYDGSITAQVKPTISSIVGWTPQNYPQIRTRELETIVTVKSGQSAIIGGLFSQDEIETITKVPILGDIPLLKELFTKRGTDVKDQEIIIVITAWTITPGQTTQLKDGIVEIKGPVL
ncbi:MAG TPA: secretin N-terminal domain-containing protein, partial [Bacillota bacterium]|nr:secretin N-terminal domain-containing protein [Bacillota bacterium]